MKKTIHCKNCNHKFEYNINNMDDMNNISNMTCPKCRSKITAKKEEVSYTTNDVGNFEDKLGNFLGALFTFSRWFYIFAPILGIVLYCFKLYMLSFSISIICLLFFVIEKILHISVFRLAIVLIPILLIIFRAKYNLPYIRDIALAVNITFLVESIIRFIKMLIFSKLIKWASNC